MSEINLEAVVRTAVGEVLRDFDMDGDDLYQEAWLWMAEHSELVEYYQQMRSIPTASAYLKRDILRRLRSVAKTEKAYREGFEPTDIYTYSAESIELRGLIAECLRAIVTGTREPTKGEQVGPSNADPAEASMNFVVSMIDVERGWKRLREEDQKLLASFFVYDVGAMTLAAEHDVTQQEVYRKLKRALRRLVGPINGMRA